MSMNASAPVGRIFPKLVQAILALGAIALVSGCSTPERLQWGSVLPDKYANCVSERMPIGTPYPGPRSPTGPTVRCKKDSEGYFVGDTLNGRRIEDSDAVRACWSRGGRLPTAEELAKMTSDEPTQKSNEIYWSSTIHSNPSRALAYVRKEPSGTTTAGKNRSDLAAVRCVMP